MKTKISMSLEFGVCNGSMIADIYSNEILVTTIKNARDEVLIDFETDLPAKLKIAVSNKDNSLDTLLDDSGLVIQDKYVKLTRLSVGYIPVSSGVLFNICRYTPEHGAECNNTYWGFNGIATIDISKSDSLDWHLSLDNKFDL